VWFNKPEYLADERRAAAEFEEKEAVEAEVLKVKRDALTVARESAKESERKRKAYQEDNQEKNKTIKALKEESKALREEVKRLYKACEASPMLIEKWLGQTSLSPDMQITKNGHTVARKKRLKKATR
jgi:flagellar motility protein MotE (MotC chaperone)